MALRLFHLGLAFLLFCAGCNQAIESEMPRTVTEILEDPGQFEGARVMVRGYLQSDGQFWIYATAEAADSYAIERAIRVRDESEGGTLIQSPCEGRLVDLKGTLFTTAIEYGEIVPFLYIGDVEAVRFAETEEICWEPKGL